MTSATEDEKSDTSNWHLRLIGREQDTSIRNLQ